MPYKPVCEKVPRSDYFLINAAIVRNLHIEVVATDNLKVLCKMTQKQSKIRRVLNDLDEARLNFYLVNDNRSTDDQDRSVYQGHAVIIYDHGQLPEEIVSDYSALGIISEIMERYWQRHLDSGAHATE
jgi:hypothetical protein